MEEKQKNRFKKMAYLLLIVAGCVLACSTIIPNDYLKIAVVLVTLCVGIFGIMKQLGNSPETKDDK
ncbi:MAG: hypothetical protein LBD27_03405 [Tannerella sp.]|jgi:predicted membrane channel-forming protein YqfA (hemolysin III family)|nr:hypothetical protein [Tannerella sp.]